MSSKKQCSVCGQTAKVFVTLVKTGHVSHSSYCVHHADELGLLGDGAYALLDSGETKGTTDHDANCCPGCGFGLRDWKRTGRFGCAECYDAFADKIRPALERLHTDTVHRGKIPSGAVSPSLINNRIRELRARLESAVKDERFEDAAEARDEMSALRAHAMKQ
ncbi:MAG: UvrB/UvrC motif-containing protein [Puniceicoccales bacterium]